MRQRESARVLLVDDKGRLLLYCAEDNTVLVPGQPPPGPFWVTVGGALEPGETFEDAARREVFEETGIHDMKLGQWIWERAIVLDWRGEVVRSYERYFLASTPTTAVTAAHLNESERDVFKGYRWWSAKELLEGERSEIFKPPELPQRFHTIQTAGPPARPLRIA